MMRKILGFAATLAVLAAVGLSASTCATATDNPALSPSDDAGEGGPTCGEPGLPCCPNDACSSGNFCNEGTCKPQRPDDLGKACITNADCKAGLCVAIETDANADGGVRTVKSVCTTGCSSTAQCTAGWQCSVPVAGRGVCTCTYSPEICDKKDNDCNAIVDDEPAVDKACTAAATGGAYVCTNGACVCAHDCGGTCVDPSNDASNCGACGVVCPAGAPCTNGKCGCHSGQTVCSNACVDTTSDSANCGTCGKTCKATENCTASKCVCAATLCAGQCVDFNTDPNNCGGCGAAFACGYSCVGGQCQPLALATGLQQAQGLAVDATNVYWSATPTFSSTLYKCAVGGCGGTATALASNLGYIYALAAASSKVYWGDTGASTIADCTVASCTPAVLASNQSYPQALAVDANNVYWANNFGNNVEKCALAGCGGTPTSIASTLVSSPNAIAVDATSVYWGNSDGSVQKCALAGGCTNPTPLVNGGGSVQGMVVTGGKVFWTTGFSGTVLSCPVAGCVTPTTVVSGELQPWGITTDGTSLYWTNYSSGGTIRKCPVVGCVTPTTIAGGQSSPQYIAVDATSVYWLTSTGAYKFKK